MRKTLEGNSLFDEWKIRFILLKKETNLTNGFITVKFV